MTHAGLNSAPSTSNLSSMLDPNHRNYNPAFAKEFSALSKADCDAMWRFDADDSAANVACRAVAKLAEDPEFHFSAKLEPGDLELIHNP